MPTGFLTNTPQQFQRAVTAENRKLEEQETAKKAKLLRVPYMDLQGFPIDLNVLSLWSEDEANALQALPFYKEGRDLKIGAVDPKLLQLSEKTKQLANKFKVELYLISKSAFEQEVKFYKK